MNMSTNTETKYKYGCIPDTNPNPDDKLVRFKLSDAKKYMDLAGLQFSDTIIPPTFDLLSTLQGGLPVCQKPYNQETIGSCSAHGAAFIYVFEQLKQNNINPIMPSRLDIYYKTRAASGQINVDSGATISAAVNTLI